MGELQPVNIIDRQMVGERPDTNSSFIFPFRATCDFENEGWGCSFDEVFYTLQAARWASEHHEHFKTYQQRRYNYLSIAEKIWVELDSVIDDIKAGFESDKAKDVAIGRASGLAFAIVAACHPYYDDERAVSKEANRRWKMRNSQLEWAPTLGFKYSPPPIGIPQINTVETVGRENPVHVQTRRRGQTPAEAAAAKLKPADRESIKRGIESGMFQPEDLAKVYGTTKDVVLFIAQA